MTGPERIVDVTPRPPMLVSLAEGARLLGVSTKWIRAHRASLRWVVELSPRVLRVDVEAMRRWVERRRA